MQEPETEVLFDGNRIAFTDSDGDGVWFTRSPDGKMVVESDELYIELTDDQRVALRWVQSDLKFNNGGWA